MSTAGDRVLAFLEGLGFEAKRGEFAAFEMRLSLVDGVVWDETTAQLALVAEASGEEHREAWKQLLFAAAGLRYQLTADRLSAFGSPLVLAVVDEAGERMLRGLVESLSRDYAVFTRVDLNFVKHRDLEDEEALLDALAPLLPRCRAGLKKQIAKDEVRRFWRVLRERVEETASELDPAFEGFRTAAGSAAADALVGDLDERPDLPPLDPIWSLKLRDFRSFEDGGLDLSQVTIVHGANGTGKSALLEGLELLWAGTTQRKPWGVQSDLYQRHLPRDGAGDFLVEGEGEAVAEVASVPAAELVRSVLTQEEVGALVASAPENRYERFLAITGLEVPELDQRTDSFLVEAKRETDEVLVAAGLPPLKSKGANALTHLRKALGGEFASRLPQRHELAGIEGVLADVSKEAFSAREWPGEAEAVEALEAAELLLARMPKELDDLGPLDRASEAVESLAAARRDAARKARLLLDAMPSVLPDQAPPAPKPGKRPGKDPAVPRALAARWLGHGRALVEDARAFEEEGAQLGSKKWAERLAAYAETLREAAATVPERELDRFLQAAAAPAAAMAPETTAVPEARYRDAGFSRSPDAPGPLVEVVGEYADSLQRQVAELDALVAELKQHPARRFEEHAPRVLAAICKFEIARRLRRGGPIAEASKEMVGGLLQGVLAPVVRELVAALVRFEWYFKPLLISDLGDGLTIGGLGTSKPDLDARMVLNSAERNVVGLAWFLALHLLQPRDRRRVLAVDDASAAFDTANQAGFVATMRAFVRLVRPEQVVLVSHSDALAEALAEEFAPVDSWPREVARFRCRRDKDDASTIDPEARFDESRPLRDEVERLGLTGEKAPA